MKNLHSQRGFNLIELMVSVVISMLVLAGIASMFTSQKQASRTQDAAGQLQESARVVTQSFLANIKQAGYRRLLATAASVKTYGDEGWTDTHIATFPVSFVSGGTDSITIRYESGDAFNPATGAGADCTGAAPAILAASNPTIPVVSNTYSVNAAGQLVCTNPAGASVVLANSVLDFQVRAGLSATTDAADNDIVIFQTPDLVTAGDMPRVRAVEICFVLQSDNSAGQSSAGSNTYMGCNGPMTLGTADRRLRQVFRQTATIRNSVLRTI
jgi:type IV pilus assembly protein PilW